MDLCPPEVLHHIFSRLEFNGVAGLRLAGKKYAAVGTEYLVTRVRVHMSKESLLRLQAFEEHETFHKRVKSVVFEGAMVADVGCENSYAAHFDLHHHANEKPQPLSENATQREHRLYDRNLAKFNQGVLQKYQRCRNLYDQQQALLADDLLEEVIGNVTEAFPKLESLTLTNVGRCKHSLSERFLEIFGVDCAVPMDPSTDHIATQLGVLLWPTGLPFISLKNLTVTNIDPSLFITKSGSSKMAKVFQSLTKIKLVFRMTSDDRLLYDSSSRNPYHRFNDGGLHSALSAAKNLEQMLITFNDYAFAGWATDVQHILGDTTVWPKLVWVEADYITIDSPDYLINAIQRQPSLKKFWIGYATLLNGTWIDATKQMREKLSLETFMASGFLDDEEEAYPMHFVDADAYIEDSFNMDCTCLLDIYVTDKEYMQDIEDFHPLQDLPLADPEDLHEEFGSLADSDTGSHMDCDD